MQPTPGSLQWASTVTAAVEVSAAVLTPFTGRYWRAETALDSDWSVWDTVAHVNDVLYFYAGQTLLADEHDYLCFELAADDHANPERLLAALLVNGRLLAAAVTAADPAALAHHNYGASDPAGFAAMGVLESLVHTYDAVRGLDPRGAWSPPDDLAAVALERLFPDATVDDGHPPSDRLLHACGRIPLGDRPRRTDWRWDGTPRVN